MDTNTSFETVHENRLAGTVGAFLFALVGGIVYFLLWQVGFIASISGIISVICAMKGYEIFAAKKSKFGIVISAVMSALVIIIAWYLCLSFDVFKAYNEWYESGEIDYAITFADAVRGAYLFLEEPDIASEYLVNLAIGIALCAVGCISTVRNAVNRLKTGTSQHPQSVTSEESVSTETHSEVAFNEEKNNEEK